MIYITLPQIFSVFQDFILFFGCVFSESLCIYEILQFYCTDWNFVFSAFVSQDSLNSSSGSLSSGAGSGNIFDPQEAGTGFLYYLVVLLPFFL